MSIRWVRNVMVDGEKSTLEILLGASTISDKCYVRINTEKELWFYPRAENRNEILDQGIEILKQKLEGHQIKNPNGHDFNWQ